MKAAVFCMLLVAAVGRAAAAPTGYYNAATGDLSVSNDAGFTLSVFLFATGGFTTNLSAYHLPPGTNMISGNLPDSVVINKYPAGKYDLGAIVIPGTPIGNISSVWYPSTFDTVAMFLPIEAVPEPGSGALAVAGVAAATAARRRTQ